MLTAQNKSQRPTENESRDGNPMFQKASDALSSQKDRVIVKPGAALFSCLVIFIYLYIYLHLSDV